MRRSSFGSDVDAIEQFLGHSLSSRSKIGGVYAQYLQSLQLPDESMQMITLMELCENLSMISSEEQLRSFPHREFMPELLRLSLTCDHNPELLVLVTRALTYIMDAIPETAASLAEHPVALQALCGRLLSIEYIDLAEQTLQCLQKVSHVTAPHGWMTSFTTTDSPLDGLRRLTMNLGGGNKRILQACLRAGALPACLTYLDFLPTAVQRTALSIVCDLTAHYPASEECGPPLTDVVPLLANLLSAHDQSVMELACIAISHLAHACGPQRIHEICSDEVIDRLMALLASSVQRSESPNTSNGPSISLPDMVTFALLHTLCIYTHAPPDPSTHAQEPTGVTSTSDAMHVITLDEDTNADGSGTGVGVGTEAEAGPIDLVSEGDEREERKEKRCLAPAARAMMRQNVGETIAALLASTRMQMDGDQRARARTPLVRQGSSRVIQQHARPLPKHALARTLAELANMLPELPDYTDPACAPLPFDDMTGDDTTGDDKEHAPMDLVDELTPGASVCDDLPDGDSTKKSTASSESVCVSVFGKEDQGLVDTYATQLFGALFRFARSSISTDPQSLHGALSTMVKCLCFTSQRALEGILQQHKLLRFAASLLQSGILSLQHAALQTLVVVLARLDTEVTHAFLKEGVVDQIQQLARLSLDSEPSTSDAAPVGTPAKAPASTPGSQPTASPLRAAFSFSTSSPVPQRCKTPSSDAAPARPSTSSAGDEGHPPPALLNLLRTLLDIDRGASPGESDEPDLASLLAMAGSSPTAGGAMPFPAMLGSSPGSQPARPQARRPSRPATPESPMSASSGESASGEMSDADPAVGGESMSAEPVVRLARLILATHFTSADLGSVQGSTGAPVGPVSGAHKLGQLGTSLVACSLDEEPALLREIAITLARSNPSPYEFGRSQLAARLLEFFQKRVASTSELRHRLASFAQAFFTEVDLPASLSAEESMTSTETPAALPKRVLPCAVLVRVLLSALRKSIDFAEDDEDPPPADMSLLFGTALKRLQKPLKIRVEKDLQDMDSMDVFAAPLSPPPVLRRPRSASTSHSHTPPAQPPAPTIPLGAAAQSQPPSSSQTQRHQADVFDSLGLRRYEHGTDPLLVEPLASISSISRFLWPRAKPQIPPPPKKGSKEVKSKGRARSSSFSSGSQKATAGKKGGKAAQKESAPSRPRTRSMSRTPAPSPSLPTTPPSGVVTRSRASQLHTPAPSPSGSGYATQSKGPVAPATAPPAHSTRSRARQQQESPRDASPSTGKRRRFTRSVTSFLGIFRKNKSPPSPSSTQHAPDTCAPPVPVETPRVDEEPPQETKPPPHDTDEHQTHAEAEGKPEAHTAGGALPREGEGEDTTSSSAATGEGEGEEEDEEELLTVQPDESQDSMPSQEPETSASASEPQGTEAEATPSATATVGAPAPARASCHATVPRPRELDKLVSAMRHFRRTPSEHLNRQLSKARARLHGLISSGESGAAKQEEATNAAKGSSNRRKHHHSHGQSTPSENAEKNDGAQVIEVVYRGFPLSLNDSLLMLMHRQRLESERTAFRQNAGRGPIPPGKPKTEAWDTEHPLTYRLRRTAQSPPTAIPGIEAFAQSAPLRTRPHIPPHTHTPAPAPAHTDPECPCTSPLLSPSAAKTQGKASACGAPSAALDRMLDVLCPVEIFRPPPGCGSARRPGTSPLPPPPPPPPPPHLGSHTQCMHTPHTIAHFPSYLFPPTPPPPPAYPPPLSTPTHETTTATTTTTTTTAAIASPPLTISPSLTVSPLHTSSPPPAPPRRASMSAAGTPDASPARRTSFASSCPPHFHARSPLWHCTLPACHTAHAPAILLRLLFHLNARVPLIAKFLGPIMFSEGLGIGIRACSEDEAREEGKEQVDWSGLCTLPEDVFVSHWVARKVDQELHNPLSLVLRGVNWWTALFCQELPFLLPFAQRRLFFATTALGFGRAMRTLHHEMVGDSADVPSARLPHQKVRLQRNHMFSAAMRLFDTLAESRAMLDIEFIDEVGTGQGPTLEFFSTVSKDLQRRSLGIWLEDADLTTESSKYVHAKQGLFPRPFDPHASDALPVIAYFRFLGIFVGRALTDGRLLDLPLSTAFWKTVLCHPLTLGDLADLSPALARSLDRLVAALTAAETAGTETHEERAVLVDGAPVETLALTFSVPGTEIALCRNGNDREVTSANYAEYVHLLLEFYLRGGAFRAQIEAFRQGLSYSITPASLCVFTPQELEAMTTGADCSAEEWTVGMLSSAILCERGYTQQSRVMHDLFHVLAEFTSAQRRAFLTFATGSPRIPLTASSAAPALALGSPAAPHTTPHEAPSASRVTRGLHALRPPLTVVRKIAPDGLHPDEVLPSVMTCNNYLKLPEYSSRDMLKKRLLTAITEGQGAFLLS